ncbi:hypothetical protein [Sphingomonas sp. CFBP 13720]|uniref:hypothetical protein n=1 Tax=Sphingomonas sp. CFBP 13720 TaxID=2775302 RepID=UPI00178553CA|nr:hypothetical protein [Sphingomonas sp. CFBP 13720]MBD8679459.1 hypothetical protein [Sphingomonas sp. CFBP 13720]
MADDGKVPMQAMGTKSDAATPDGTNLTDKDNGREGGGESNGGAYPNPHTGSDDGGFEGGQSLRDYHGGPGGADNEGAGTD